MKRRDVLKGIGASAVAAGIGACAPKNEVTPGIGSSQTFKWKMVTTWPPNFPGAGTGASHLAELIEKNSAGRLKIRVYGGGELVPPFEVFDAVSGGTAEMGHGASYYWKGKSEATQFFAAVPFGMNAQQMNAWLYQGDGLKLWREIYEPFNLIPTAAGNTGMQMGGWFNKEINSVEDLKGLNMRIPGLGGEVLARAGGNPITIPGAEVFTALQTGVIDAAEWIGPYNDMAFGMHKAAKHYYYPGWHEPCATLECMINKTAFEALTQDLQGIVLTACAAVNDLMLAEYTAQNHKALKILRDEHGVVPKPFPDDVLKLLHKLSREVLEELAEKDTTVKKVYESYRSFQDGANDLQKITEHAYFDIQLGQT